jgi:hypothetical protein
MQLLDKERHAEILAEQIENVGIELSFEAVHAMNSVKDRNESEQALMDQEVSAEHIDPTTVWAKNQGKSAGKAASKRKSFHLFPKKVKKTSSRKIPSMPIESSRLTRIQRMTKLVIEDSESQAAVSTLHSLEIKLTDNDVLSDDSAQGDEHGREASQSGNSSTNTKDQCVNLVNSEFDNEAQIEPPPIAETSLPKPVAIPLQLPLVVKTASPTEKDSILGVTFSVMSGLTEDKDQFGKDFEGPVHHNIVAFSKTQIMEAADAGQRELANIVADLENASQSPYEKMPEEGMEDPKTSRVKSLPKVNDEGIQYYCCHYETESKDIGSPTTLSFDKANTHEDFKTTDNVGMEVSAMADTVSLAEMSDELCMTDEPHLEATKRIEPTVKSNEEPTVAVPKQSKEKKQRKVLSFFTKRIEKKTDSTDQEGSIDDENSKQDPSPKVSILRNVRKGGHSLNKTKKQSSERPSRSSMSLGLSAKRFFSKTAVSKSKQELGDLETHAEESISTSPEDDSLWLSTSSSEEANTTTTFHFAFDGGCLVSKEETEECLELHAKGSPEREDEVWRTLRFEDDDTAKDHDEQVNETAEPSIKFSYRNSPNSEIPSDKISSTPVESSDNKAPFATILPSDFINFDDLASDVETQASFAVEKIMSLGDINVDLYVDAESQLSAITEKVKAIGSCKGMDCSLQDGAKKRIEALSDQVINLTSDGTYLDIVPANLCGEKCDHLKVCGDIIIDECNAFVPFESNKHKESIVDTPTDKVERYSKHITVVPTTDNLEGFVNLYLSDEENSILAASIDDDDDSLFSSLDEIILRENPKQCKDPSDVNVLWEDKVM